MTLRARPYPASRILLAGSGAIGVALLPAWIFWIRQHFELEVRVALTRRAEQLVSVPALAALSGHAVLRELESDPAGPSVPHVEAARWADAILVAPATANVIARIAHGLADDLVTTTVLAAECPVVVVPSLTPAMSAKPATQRNLRTLREDGYGIVPAADGLDAYAGAAGSGAMADPPTALAYLKRFILERAQEPAA